MEPGIEGAYRPSPETNESDGEALTFDLLADKLHFVETPNMQAQRQEIAQVWADDPEHAGLLRNQYINAAEELLNQLGQAEYASAQVGLEIALALMYRDAGLEESFFTRLDDVHIMLFGLVQSGRNDLQGIADDIKGMTDAYFEPHPQTTASPEQQD